jgi:acetamidase/formamidase
MTVTLRITLRQDLRVDGPEYEVARQRALPAGGFYATTGVGPDLFAAARDAVSRMIDHLTRTRGLDAQHAYALCSVAADLQISEIVDAPNWVVSAVLPNGVFR